jgi:hypothetical protein
MQNYGSSFTAVEYNKTMFYKERKMVDEKSWGEFRNCGLLWWVNTLLHTFGWAICIEINEQLDITRAFPARVKFRGFDETSNTRGYILLSQFMKDNAEVLLKEANQ